MRTSYHVHSTFSDGATSIDELVDGANLQILDQLGISDHYVVMPGGKPCSWSMPIDNLPAYVESIRNASQKAREGLIVLKGLEADFFPETMGELKERLAPYNLDYVIGSVHFLDGFPIDADPENWENLDEKERNDVIRGYWSRITEMARTGFYSFAGHLDLYKKFGCAPTIDITANVEEALDAIAASGMAVELNTSGLHAPAGEMYPSPFILRECRKRSIPVLVNADAHTPENLTRSYDEAFLLLKEAGYNPASLWTVKI